MCDTALYFRTAKISLIFLLLWHSGVLAGNTMPNSCPVDGCEIKILRVAPENGELRVTFVANFTPDVSKNHIHVWWGEQYDVKQVGRNAKSEFGVVQGKWHRHDDYPEYLTTGAASMEVRGTATSLCTTAADRNHNVLDPNLYHCLDISEHL